ncbi:hypothetical protein [Roseomonas populi]|uniref:Glycosyltransferase RgtA/B/C/D-like domain-containing protein n=1 Tax=Roseomonas populi TaxID=3121582 RepID=A0ABT1WXC0_9PROT|nr:hypothetical protein [Roseomonas pecuniae]MCR0980488.1 hypothetical protein [Roseomonas pecuniae]
MAGNADASARLRLVLPIALGLSVLAAAALVFRYGHYPSAADSWSYGFYAFRFRMHGPLHDFGTVRTYGYPLLLLPLTFLSGYEPARLAAIAGSVQYALYVAACLWLAAGLRRTSPRWALATALALLLGPLGLALVTDVLTEAPSLIVTVLLAGLAVRLDGPYAAGRTEAALVIGGALAGFALMVRPANLPLLLAWNGAVGLGLLLAPGWAAHRGRLLAATISGGLFGAASWLPQFLYNWHVLGEPGVLPACRLGGFQVTFGALVWKYDTVMGLGAAAGGWYTPNPLFSGHLEAGEGWAWYFAHPFRAAATMLAHLFLSFDVRSPFVYLYDRLPWYGPLVRPLYWAATVLAAFRIAGLAGHAIRERRWSVTPAFLSMACGAILAINAISAIETRFNAIPLAVAMVVAAEALLALHEGHLRWGWGRWGAIAALALLLTGAGSWVERTGSASLPPASSFNLPRSLRCVLTAESEQMGDPEVMRRHDEEMAARRATP